MLFKFFMKPSLMWVFHMNAGACERLEFTLWPQLTAWTTVTRYIVAYMSDSRLLIISWSIAWCWSELRQCVVFCTTAYKWGSTNSVYKYLCICRRIVLERVLYFIKTHTARMINRDKTTYVLPCHIHEKTSEDASVSATITMVLKWFTGTQK